MLQHYAVLPKATEYHCTCTSMQLTTQLMCVWKREGEGGEKRQVVVVVTCVWETARVCVRACVCECALVHICMQRAADMRQWLVLGKKIFFFPFRSSCSAIAWIALASNVLKGNKKISTFLWNGMTTIPQDDACHSATVPSTKHIKEKVWERRKW